MTENHFSDNCSHWTPNSSKRSWLLSKNDEIEVWHRRLGHVNLYSLYNALSQESILGIPPLHTNDDSFCDDYQIGKQIKASHKIVSHFNTNKVLELLHMDLLEPIQVESLGGKRYVFVCVNDISRFTWVRFIKEMSETFKVCRTLCLWVKSEQEVISYHLLANKPSRLLTSYPISPSTTKLLHLAPLFPSVLNVLKQPLVA